MTCPICGDFGWYHKAGEANKRFWCAWCAQGRAGKDVQDAAEREAERKKAETEAKERLGKEDLGAIAAQATTPRRGVSRS